MLRKRGKKFNGCFADKVKNCLGRNRCSSRGEPASLKNCKGKVKVCKVNGDRKTCARMASMGLYPGVEADIICAENGSQCLLKINGGTLSLDPTISENILVTSL